MTTGVFNARIGLNSSPPAFVANSLPAARGMKDKGRQCLTGSSRPPFDAFPAPIAVIVERRIIDRLRAARESNRSRAATHPYGRGSRRNVRQFADAATMLLYAVDNKPIWLVENLLEVYGRAKSPQRVANLGLLSQSWESPC
jgi:hypothetical protein